MDMLNDHIRLVQFGYDGEVEKISLLLRLAPLVMHQRAHSVHLRNWVLILETN